MMGTIYLEKHVKFIFKYKDNITRIIDIKF